MAGEKINQLQLLQQNLQNIILQKQQLANQNIELDSALLNLQKTTQAYRIIGNIMVASSQEELSKDLQDKKEIVELRLKSLLRQEEKLKENIEKIQEEVLKELKKDKDAGSD